MGCCKSSSIGKVAKTQTEVTPATQEEAAKLGVLLPDEEYCKIARRGKLLSEEVERLRELTDKKPARITAVSLAGDTIAEFDASVSAKVQQLENCICLSANIDTSSFDISLTYEGEVLSKLQKLCEVGVQPEQGVILNVVKSPKSPKVKNPALDRELFQEAWMGGGHLDTIQALLESNADPNGFTYSDGDRAIHVAAGRGHVDAVRLLLGARADANVRGVYGMTPMERCSQQSTTYWKGRHPRVQELLRQHAAVLKATANQR